MERGRGAEFVGVVHNVAAYSGTLMSNLTLEVLRRVERNRWAALNDDSTSRLGALHRILREIQLGSHHAAIKNLKACLIYEIMDHSMEYSIFTFGVTTCGR